MDFEECNKIMYSLAKYLGFEDFDVYKEDYSRFGFSELWKIGEHINVYLNGPINKDGFETWRVEITGQGCRELEDRDINYYEFFNKLYLEFKAKATRLDIAIDDFTGDICTFDMILNKLESGCYTSTFRNGYERLGKRDTGFSIMFGGRKSTRTLLIYEKDMERKEKGFDLGIDYWKRFEMRWLQDRANDLFKMLRSEDFDLSINARGFLYEMLDIKVKYAIDVEHSERISTVSWWTKFLGAVEKVKVQNQSKIESTLLSKNSWYKKSMTVLDMLLSVANDSKDPFVNYSNELLVKKENILDKMDENKITGKHLSIINSYRRKVGLEPFRSVGELVDFVVRKIDNTVNILNEEPF